jgi:cyclopropane-fatty-acyl-phospholipid synthase
MIQQIVVERLIYSRLNYWLVLVGDILGAVAFLAFGIRISNGSVPDAVVSVALGCLAWGGVEYAVHRWLLHGSMAVIRRAHAQHHADGTALISAPALLSLAVACTIYAFLAIFVRTARAAFVVAGLYAGYNYYALLHHLLHRRPALITRVAGAATLERAHRIHHRRFVVNYGVTTTWWDRLFGSYQA